MQNPKSENSSECLKSPSKTPMEAQTDAFVHKLYCLIEHKPFTGLQWNHDGDVVVLDMKEMQNYLVSDNSLFDIKMVNLFEQHLNWYGFQEYKFGDSVKLYQHENFRCGREDLLPQVRRTQDAAINPDCNVVNGCMWKDSDEKEILQDLERQMQMAKLTFLFSYDSFVLEDLDNDFANYRPASVLFGIDADEARRAFFEGFETLKEQMEEEDSNGPGTDNSDSMDLDVTDTNNLVEDSQKCLGEKPVEAESQQALSRDDVI